MVADRRPVGSHDYNAIAKQIVPIACDHCSHKQWGLPGWACFKCTKGVLRVFKP